MISAKITKFFDKNKIKYEAVEHKTAYTAYDKAATLKIKPNIVAKTLVLKTDRDLVLVLLPGNKNLDFGKIKKLIVVYRKNQGMKAVKKIDFVSETVIKNKFKGVKIGAIPPVSGLWKLPIFIDNSLVKLPKVILSAGNHENSIKIKGSDLKKLNPESIFGSFNKAK
jgi:prolyl-tRNA editing enzyme YbaK/EbsC (Cys-tRNA(Pro) deacylase)